MNKKYNPRKIESKWQKIWQEKMVYEPNLKASKKPFYNLMMFPYPSAEGLHVGNMYAFTGSDIYGRFKRMQGYDVFEPIGLDGFGIHSENYALKIGRHPMKQAKISEKRFYKQLQMIGNGFAWDERLETYDSNYYKWTQWIFIQLFKNGLAYRKKQAVNWCPSCKTVLADEQVVNGKCERCEAEAVKKELEQWFFKITKYAEKLLKGLGKIDWSEKVKIAQKNWIGRSEGTKIRFKIIFPRESALSPRESASVEVFTTRIDTIFGCTYLVVAPEHEIIKNLEGRIQNIGVVRKYAEQAKKKSDLQRTELEKNKTGVELKGIKAINPFNNEKIPIFVADYVLSHYGTGAVMAVPAHDQRDWEFAKKFKLPSRIVICPNYPAPICPVLDRAYEKDAYVVASGQFTGLTSKKAREEMTKWLEKNKLGQKKINYKLRDWLISRQRYWGPPIPMIYCQECASRKREEQKEMPGWYAVQENDLPVKLPFIKDFKPRGKGESPLASVKSFYEVKCPKCGKKARRETDVSDTFLDSAWYYIEYLAKKISDFGFRISDFRKPILQNWLPVDMYIGGAEHSILHLLYSRFVAMVLNDLGIIDFNEPFTKFRAHGLLIREGAKMSKSKGNIVNPDEYIKKFGADAFRMYLMFLAPFERGGDFRGDGILGITRFLERVWKLFSSANNEFRTNKRLCVVGPRRVIRKFERDSLFVDRLLHQTIKKVTEDIENLRYNTAISALMILLNEIEKNPQHYSIATLQQFLLLLAPFAPHLAEELWSRFFVNKKSRIRDSQSESGRQLKAKSKFRSIHQEQWPKYNPRLIKETQLTLVIQVNGKVRDKISVASGISQKEAEKIVLSRGKIKLFIGNRKIKKIIFVPNRLINIVI